MPVVATKMAGGVSSHQTQLINHAKAGVKSGCEHFKTKFRAGGVLEVAVSAFNLASGSSLIVEVKSYTN